MYSLHNSGKHVHQLKYMHIARVTRCILYVVLHKQSTSACILNQINNGKQRKKTERMGDVMSEWVDAAQWEHSVCSETSGKCYLASIQTMRLSM